MAALHGVRAGGAHLPASPLRGLRTLRALRALRALRRALSQLRAEASGQQAQQQLHDGFYGKPHNEREKS